MNYHRPSRNSSVWIHLSSHGCPPLSILLFTLCHVVRFFEPLLLRSIKKITFVHGLSWVKQAPANKLLMGPSALKFHEVGAEYLKMVQFYTSGKPAWWIDLIYLVLLIASKKDLLRAGNVKNLNRFVIGNNIALIVNAGKPGYCCYGLATLGRGTVNKLNYSIK